MIYREACMGYDCSASAKTARHVIILALGGAAPRLLQYSHVLRSEYHFPLQTSELMSISIFFDPFLILFDPLFLLLLMQCMMH